MPLLTSKHGQVYAEGNALEALKRAGWTVEESVQPSEAEPVKAEEPKTSKPRTRRAKTTDK